MLAKEDLFAAPHTPRPRYGEARRARPPVGWLPTDNFSNPRAGAASQPHAARSSIGAKRAV